MSILRLETNFAGQITTGIEEDTTLTSTLEFVSQQLIFWRDDPDRAKEEGEDRLNLQLCKFLDSKARATFPMIRFDHEEYQTERRRVDLSASPVKTTFIGAKQHTIYDPFLVMECKRLPPPTHGREKEYVTGGSESRTGGIQRFKLGLHGSELNDVAIIGYLQKESTTYWYQTINKWISDLCGGIASDGCVWSDNEELEFLYEDNTNGIANYQSTHNRMGSKLSNQIKIRHLWVVML